MTTLNDLVLDKDDVSKYLSRYEDVVTEYKANISNGRNVVTVTANYLEQAKVWAKSYIVDFFGLDNNVSITNAEILEEPLCYNIIYRAFLDGASFSPETITENERQILFSYETYELKAIDSLQILIGQIEYEYEDDVVPDPVSKYRFSRCC